ncbi:hypothetical protein [Rickettsia endosymbiont of Ceutorhynchus obstrictus]|uniref:hypothetical protein n=1 Tax=Rickettsia endosymbiont of Ceutorhynchus obstrictus TaxID=3066249 RepID=UPI003133228C
MPQERDTNKNNYNNNKIVIKNRKYLSFLLYKVCNKLTNPYSYQVFTLLPPKRDSSKNNYNNNKNNDFPP